MAQEQAYQHCGTHFCAVGNYVPKIYTAELYKITSLPHDGDIMMGL
jgi:hypothetical protein